MGDHRIANLTADEGAGPALSGAEGAPHDQHHADTVVGQVALHPRKRDPMIGGTDHERVLRQPTGIECIENRPDAPIQAPGTNLERGHIPPGLRGVGQRIRRLAVPRVLDRPGVRKHAMGLTETDREKEGLGRRVVQEVRRGRGDMFDAPALNLRHPVVPDERWIPGHMLHPDQRRAVAGRPKRVYHVLSVVVQHKAAMGQAEHPAAVGTLAGH